MENYVAYAVPYDPAGIPLQITPYID